MQPAEKMKQLDREFTLDVEPSMMYFRNKKQELEPKWGERWAEDLFPLGSKEQDVAEVTQLFWDDVKTLGKGKGDQKKVLDDSFFDGNWAERGKQYRLLVEPVDIANYYHRGLHNRADSRGHYIDGITLELSDDNNVRPGRYILLQKQEQRLFCSRTPNYTTQSSLRLARLLKDSIGKRTWDEYQQQQRQQEQQQQQAHDRPEQGNEAMCSAPNTPTGQHSPQWDVLAAAEERQPALVG